MVAEAKRRRPEGVNAREAVALETIRLALPPSPYFTRLSRQNRNKPSRKPSLNHIQTRILIFIKINYL